ncbi:MAG: SDR family NAD(P)-dependent oxidoreductase [Caulobacteraceae bacterium]|nr:SDR family NAD(P)-dependent oxidoreductase [Caulobacteraceae bacterium]
MAAAARAGGIGTAIAEQLIARGARVALVDLSLARAEQAASELGSGKASAVHLDVTKLESRLAAREEVERQLGPCDIVVSNAGVSYTGTLDRIERCLALGV